MILFGFRNCQKAFPFQQLHKNIRNKAETCPDFFTAFELSSLEQKWRCQFHFPSQGPFTVRVSNLRS